MLGQLDYRHGAVVADFEAGLGTVLRMQAAVDVVVIVVQPTVKSLEVGVRAAEAVRGGALGRVVVVANRMGDDEDLGRVRAAFDGFETVVVPDDPDIAEAERFGHAPMDAAPHSAAVASLSVLAERLRPAR